MSEVETTETLDLAEGAPAGATSLRLPYWEREGGGQPENLHLSQETEPLAQEESRDKDVAKVPLTALRKERARRAKVDAELRELQREMQRYEDQKFGIEQPEQSEQHSEGRHAPEWQQRALSYNRSCETFVSKHGQESYNALEAAVGQLTPMQKTHVLALVEHGDGDPVERIHGYVKQLGLIDTPAEFKPRSIQDVIAGKKGEEANSVPNDKALKLEQARADRVEAAERRATARFSQANFISEFGRADYHALDAATETFMNSGDPRAAEVAAAIVNHSDPVIFAATVMSHLGLWSPGATSQPQPSRPAMVLPSNLAGARNVGARRGPEWTGPAPLKDIFDRSRRGAA